VMVAQVLLSAAAIFWLALRRPSSVWNIARKGTLVVI
jgi:hypothetical protein